MTKPPPTLPPTKPHSQFNKEDWQQWNDYGKEQGQLWLERGEIKKQQKNMYELWRNNNPKKIEALRASLRRVLTKVIP